MRSKFAIAFALVLLVIGEASADHTILTMVNETDANHRPWSGSYSGFTVGSHGSVSATVSQGGWDHRARWALAASVQFQVWDGIGWATAATYNQVGSTDTYNKASVHSSWGGLDSAWPASITVSAGAPPSNVPPIAAAGPDVEDFVAPGEDYELVLDGGDSFDPDGEIVEWYWSLDGDVIGTDPVLSTTQAGGTSKVYTLRVVDDDAAHDTDTVNVTIGEDGDLAMPETVDDVHVRGPGEPDGPPGDGPGKGPAPPCGMIRVEGTAHASSWSGDRDFRITFDKTAGVKFDFSSIGPVELTDGYAAARLVGAMAAQQAGNVEAGRRWVANHLLRDLFVDGDAGAATGEDVDDIMDAHGEADCVEAPAGLDSDGDGIPDSIDPDRDGDGILDSIDPLIDSDGDGIPDDQDQFMDSDGDGIPDYQDPDIDGDGIPNSVDDVPAPYSPGGPLYQPYIPQPGQGGVSPPYRPQLPEGGGGMFELPDVEIAGPEIGGADELAATHYSYEIPIPIPGVEAGQSTFFVATNQTGEGAIGTATNVLRLLVRGFVLLSLVIYVGRESITTIMRW